MCAERYDVIVLGVGGLGSATLYSLATRGLKVCGVEQFGIAHDRGSSHGETRIIRKAYFEDPEYLPLLDSVYSLWRRLQEESETELLVPCEMLVAGKPEAQVITGLEDAYGTYDAPHERLSSKQLCEKFPQFRLPDNFVSYLDPVAGFLLVEKCVTAYCRLAQLKGATLYQNEKILEWFSRDGRASVKTDRRTLLADRLVITAGAWATRELRPLNLNLRLVRKVVFWYQSGNIEAFTLGRFPIFYVENDYGHFYGFPAIDELGLKIAEHSHEDIVPDPDKIDRGLRGTDEAPVLRFDNDVFPTLQPKRTRHSVCMYTKTPDEHFIIDLHPEYDNVAIACGLSGHGFKFAPIIGEVLSDLVVEGATRHPIDFLRLSRFRT